jgi:hypothetical protein
VGTDDGVVASSVGDVTEVVVAAAGTEDGVVVSPVGAVDGVVLAGVGTDDWVSVLLRNVTEVELGGSGTDEGVVVSSVGEVDEVVLAGVGTDDGGAESLVGTVTDVVAQSGEPDVPDAGTVVAVEMTVGGDTEPDEPAAVVTVTGAATAAAEGAAAVIEPSQFTVNDVAGAVPKSTDVAPVK